nr:unnamed protein product [Callosobruchus chinensis]
MTIGKGF